MRIVIDMQGAQSTGSRNRGIGRYTMALAQAIARNRGEHEVILALNGLFPDTIESIRAAFHDLLPQSDIRIWYAVAPVSYIDSGNDWRRQCAERLREAFLANLRPDILLVSSLIEGLGDDAVTSIGTLGHIPTATILYDLIPYIHRQPYLENPDVERWYLRKLDHMRLADLWLAISESSRQEGINYLNLPGAQTINISTAADLQFHPIDISKHTERVFRERYGLDRPFIMYGGGIDHRKNVEGLIQAFARLSTDLRNSHQLAIVCSARDEDKQRLLSLAKRRGLDPGDVVLTGFVPEDDLVALYNLCKLFIFPSWHEGFGLPVLEAMHCGAPVIGANRSSIPEVIGWEEALFDPYSDQAIAGAMERALSDNTFRAELVRHGKVQARKFSWDASAQRAIAAFEQFHTDRNERDHAPTQPVRRPRIAYVSPLPPARTGIADYSVELLPELARHYDLELVVAQEKVTDDQIKSTWPIRSVDWFLNHASEYDRILYQFGNSHFHSHMFELLRSIPGVVVLHDFYLSGGLAHMEVHQGKADVWINALYDSHGYGAVRQRQLAQDIAPIIWEYPCNINVLQESLGMIIHSVYSRNLARKWYGQIENSDWAIIPQILQPQVKKDRDEARVALGFRDEDFVVCSFGIIGPTKLNHRLLDAWIQSELGKNAKCQLIFVGENHDGEYGQTLMEKIKKSGLQKRVHVTGWVDGDQFRQYLAAADIGVQLRTMSRGETSRTVLDCMNYCLATIVNANGSMAELSDDAVWKLPDEFTDRDLADAIEILWQDSDRRRLLGERAKERIRQDHNPRTCADLYAVAIEGFYRKASIGDHALLSNIASLSSNIYESAKVHLAEAIALSIPCRPRPRQLFVDVSELVQRDVKSGIQRVVRSLLNELLDNPPDGLRIEPVYATQNDGYRYARRFTLKFLDCPSDVLNDEPLEYWPGDVFLGLDLQPQVVTTHRAFYQQLRRHGVQVKFVVYDLLCILLPHYFIEETAEEFTRWLDVVAENDGALCISKTVANALSDLIMENRNRQKRSFNIDWFHLGADVENSVPSKGLPPDVDDVLESIRRSRSFLMVGTIEPRKSHAVVLAAFERLWAEGEDVNLVIVGKQGWLVEGFVKKLRSHAKLNKNLYWLDGISDEYLELIYAASTCLIAASYGEGFGLPLIVAAQHKLPIIARDTPVFREVAGEHAFYFKGKEPQYLSKAVSTWLELHHKQQHPKSGLMPRITWQESSAQLLQAVLSEDGQKSRKLGHHNMAQIAQGDAS